MMGDKLDLDAMEVLENSVSISFDPTELRSALFKAIDAAKSAIEQRDRLLEAADAFSDLFLEGVEDYGADTQAVAKSGRHTDYTLTLGHFKDLRQAILSCEEGA